MPVITRTTELSRILRGWQALPYHLPIESAWHISTRRVSSGRTKNLLNIKLKRKQMLYSNWHNTVNNKLGSILLTWKQYIVWEHTDTHTFKIFSVTNTENYGIIKNIFHNYYEQQMKYSFILFIYFWWQSNSVFRWYHRAVNKDNNSQWQVNYKSRYWVTLWSLIT